MTHFSEYILGISRAILEKDGRYLKAALDVNNLSAKEAVFERARGRSNWAPFADVSAALRFQNAGNWQEILTDHCRCLHLLNDGKVEEAYVNVEATVLPFTKEFREDKDGWLCAPLVGLAHNMRAVAVAADEAAKRVGRKSPALENCGGSLQRVFASAIGGGNPLKKVPVLEIVVTLFRIYFRLNTLRLCKNLIAAVARLDFEIFPASARVTYKFFVGRLAIFDDQYEVAEDALEYALRHCHRGALSNKSRILYFLVPVKMLLGQLPSQDALHKYHLEEYTDIVEAMRTGNIQKLNATLEANQWHFIRAGTYLVLEKLKQPVLRRLLKRVVLLHAEANPDKPSQVPLETYQRALRWQQMPLDLDEVECILANLIYRGYVKAYISYAKKVLVLSKVSPFPHLKSVNLTDLF